MEKHTTSRLLAIGKYSKNTSTPNDSPIIQPAELKRLIGGKKPRMFMGCSGLVPQ
ncbi:MAG: hypothetical protein AAFP19_13305 [Bacteroidota bacterium]